MDIDYLYKLVVAVRDEGEATNDSGPAYDALVAYLEEAHLDPQRSELASCLEACFTLWVRASSNRCYGATEAELRDRIVKALGPARSQRAIAAAGVAPTSPPTASARHG